MLKRRERLVLFGLAALVAGALVYIPALGLGPASTKVPDDEVQISNLLPVVSENAVVDHHVRPDEITVAFSPGDAERTVLQAIDSARRSIEVAAYSFTSRPVASALLRARDRGVRVRIVADRSQRTARYTSVRFLANKGIEVRINSRYSIMHNKFMVIDNKAVETGSFNYTRSAQIRNAENVIVIDDAPQVAAAYRHEWDRLWREAQALQSAQ